MPHYALVIDDPVKAKLAMDATTRDAARRAGLASRETERRLAANRPVKDDLWTAADSECPLDRPNCRHCGDPAFAVSCVASGHCQQCGTAHGIAPDSVLVAKGLVLLEVPFPEPGQVWDRARRRFIAEALSETP